MRPNANNLVLPLHSFQLWETTRSSRADNARCLEASISDTFETHQNLYSKADNRKSLQEPSLSPLVSAAVLWLSWSWCRASPKCKSQWDCIGYIGVGPVLAAFLLWQEPPALQFLTVNCIACIGLGLILEKQEEEVNGRLNCRPFFWSKSAIQAVFLSTGENIWDDSDWGKKRISEERMKNFFNQICNSLQHLQFFQ